MEQDDTPESLASGSSSSSGPASSRLNAAAPEFKPRPIGPHHGNEPRRRSPHHPGEGEGIAAVAAEDKEGPVGAGQAQPWLIEAPQSRPRLIEADARKVLKKDDFGDGKKVLLKTPSGFALFHVEEVALKEDKNIWMYFANPYEAQKVMFVLGFIKAHLESAYDGVAGPGEDLCNLIEKFYKSGEELYVEDCDLKVSIEKKLDVFCICDGDTVKELLWGIKNVLHEFIHEEKDNITDEYCLPLSNELIKALQYYLINISTKMVDRYFISTFGYLCFLDINLEAVAKELRNSYDKFIALSETIEDNLIYAKLLVLALVPEFVQHYDFCKTLSPELSLKLEEAKKFVAGSGETDFTLYDIKMMVGSLDYLLNGPKVRDQILTRVKLMEASRFRSEAYQIIHDIEVANGYDSEQKIDETHYGDHVDFEGWNFRRTLLETPSGFAIFDVHEVVFQCPERIWTYFSDTCDARHVAFALGFVKVEDKSLAWNNVTKSGDKLRNLILRFCQSKKLFVQNSAFKDIIESKLDVHCLTDEIAADELMWGLRFVLSDFIPEESDHIIDEYYLPPSGLQKDLENYSINFSSTKIDRDFIYLLGHIVNLDIKLQTMCYEFKSGFPTFATIHHPTKGLIVDETLDDILRLIGDSIAKIPRLHSLDELTGVPNELFGQSITLNSDGLIDSFVQYSFEQYSIILDICKEKLLALEDLRHWNDRTKGACSVCGGQ